MKKLIIVIIGLLVGTVSAFELTIKNLSPEPLTFKWHETLQHTPNLPPTAFAFGAVATMKWQTSEDKAVVINPESSQTISMVQRPQTFKVEYPMKFEIRVDAPRAFSGKNLLGGQFKNTLEFEFSFPMPKKDQNPEKDILELNLVPFANLLKYFSALEVKFDSEETTAIRGPALSRVHDLVIKK